MNIKKLEKRDYGRIALLCFLFVGIKGAIQIPSPELSVVLNIVSDAVGTIGLICGVIWIVKAFQSRKNKSLS